MKLEIKSLNKTYNKGKVKALNNFSAEFTPGIYGLLGPNGAGKSTLMNIITNNLNGDSGEIIYNEKNILSMGKGFRDILGYMPQQQGIYKNFTARKFLFYMGALKGIRRSELKNRVEEILGMVNLKEVADKKLGAFSGGMKQRILIGQALLNNPKVLLLDEPTAGLDPMERIRVKNFISEIAIDKVVIIATHIVSDIEYIAKEVLLIKNGEILLKDTPENIIKSMEGKVFEGQISENDLEKIKSKYNISNIIKTNEGIFIRVVSEDKPKELNLTQTKSHLEDTYLYYFK